MTQVSSAVLMGLIFGALYWKSYDKSTTSFAILDTQMCIVMVTLMEVWLPYDVTLTFPTERRIFMRERRAGLCKFTSPKTNCNFSIMAISASIALLLDSAMRTACLHSMATFFTASNFHICSW